MDHPWRRAAGAALAALLILAALTLTGGGTVHAAGEDQRPTYTKPAVTPAPGLNYVVVIYGDVNLREEPGGRVIGSVPRHTVCVMQSQPVAAQVYDWYYVRLDTTSGPQYGYLRGDCVSRCTLDGTPLPGEATQSPPKTATPAPVNARGYVKTTTSGVNLRAIPNGRVLETVAKDTVLPVTGPTESGAGHVWYPVQTASGRKGYLRDDFVVETDRSGRPVATATPTARITAAPTAVSVNARGYVRTTANGVNLRAIPNGRVLETVAEDTVLPVIGPTESGAGHTWYYVQTASGRKGYLRDDFVVETDSSGRALTTAVPRVQTTPTPTPAPVTVQGYVITTRDNVNLRHEPNGRSLDKIPMDTVLSVIGPKKTGAGYTWFYVQTSSGLRGYLRDDCVTETDRYGRPIATATPKAQVTPTPTPEIVRVLGQLVTIKDSVNLRYEPNGRSLEKIPKGTVLSVIGPEKTGAGYTWHYVQTASGRRGYVRDDCVGPVGGVQPTPTATAKPADNPYSVFGTVKIIKTSVIFRETPEGRSIGKLRKGTACPVIGDLAKNGKYTWYCVYADGLVGYIRSDCATLETGTKGPVGNVNGKKSYTTVEESCAVKGYIRVVRNSTWVRSQPGGNAVAQVPADSVWPIVGEDRKADGAVWYNVRVNGRTGYIRSDCAEKLTGVKQGTSVVILSAVDPVTQRPTAAPTPEPTASVRAYSDQWQHIDIPDLARDFTGRGTIPLLDLSGSVVNKVKAGTILGRYQFYTEGELYYTMTVSKPYLPAKLRDKIASRGETYVLLRMWYTDMPTVGTEALLCVYRPEESWLLEISYDWYKGKVGDIAPNSTEYRWQILVDEWCISGDQLPQEDMAWEEPRYEGLMVSYFVFDTDRDYTGSQTETAFAIPSSYLDEILKGIP